VPGYQCPIQDHCRGGSNDGGCDCDEDGAAEGLRRRVGLRTWPHLRRVEADLVAQVRQRLGADRFDQAFAAGSGLSQRQVVAIVRDQRGTGTPAP
jgi:hypothetical protein